MAGTVDMVLRGYAGLEPTRDVLRFDPVLPEELEGLRFSVRYQRTWLRVDLTQSGITIEADAGPDGPFTVAVGEQQFEMEPGSVRQVTW
jgi:trehalose/maltose hydrolase-like predicted phosphorylase